MDESTLEVSEENNTISEAPIIDELEQPEVTPPKKRRGRPASVNIPETDLGAGEKAKPKTARPKKRAAYDNESRQQLAKQLVGIHQLAAMATGLGELQIGEPEADLLAGGLINVAQEYGLELSGKTGAAIQLIAAAAMIYIPRMRAINVRVKAEQEKSMTIYETPAN